MEWIRVTVTGQSFLLHQIRKMVSCKVAGRYLHISNGCLPKYMLLFVPSSFIMTNLPLLASAVYGEQLCVVFVV